MPRSFTTRSRSPIGALAVALLLLASACGSGGGTSGVDDAPGSPAPQPVATPSAPPPGATPATSPSPRAPASPGDLDASFGDGGVVRGAEPERLSAVSDLTLQRDGSIVVLAGIRDGDAPGRRSFALVRYHPSGALDASFGGGGIVEHQMCAPAEDGCGGLDQQGVLALPDGRLLILASEVTGALSSRLLLVTADGALDRGFGDDGVLGLPAHVERIALAPDGGVVGVGGGAGAGFAFLRLTRELAPDESLAPHGIRLYRPVREAAGETFRHLAVQPDGRILAGGRLEVVGEPAPVLARFTPDGDPDPAFADGGWLVGPPRGDLFRGVSPDAGPIAAADDGRILVELPVEHARTSRAIVRLLADGSADATWSPPSDSARQLFARADGGVVSSAVRQVIDFGVVVNINGRLSRFTVDGSRDATFGRDGTAPLPHRAGCRPPPRATSCRDTTPRRQRAALERPPRDGS